MVIFSGVLQYLAGIYVQMIILKWYLADLGLGRLSMLQSDIDCIAT